MQNTSSGRWYKHILKIAKKYGIKDIRKAMKAGYSKTKWRRKIRTKIRRAEFVEMTALAKKRAPTKLENFFSVKKEFKPP